MIVDSKKDKEPVPSKKIKDVLRFSNLREMFYSEYISLGWSSEPKILSFN